jgi:hypothetical protein
MRPRTLPFILLSISPGAERLGAQERLFMEPRNGSESACSTSRGCADPVDGLRWRLVRGGAIPPDAWVAGHERLADASGPFYICRAWFAEDGFAPRQAVPGKLAAGYAGCRVTFGGSEYEITNTAYEVLLGPLPAPRSPDRGPISWISVAAGGAIPDWVEGLGGSPTCRARHATGIHPGGRVLPEGGCLFGHAGRGYLGRSSYEVLAWSPAATPRQPRPFPAATATEPPSRSTAATLPRADRDRPDDAQGMQIHLVYALASNSPDAQRDILGHINDQVEVAQRWLMAQVGRRMRFDAHGGVPDVTVLRLPQSWQEIQRTGVDTVLRMAMRDVGLRVAHKYNVVFYEGPRDNGDCGAYAGEGTNAVVFLRRVDVTQALVPCTYSLWGARDNPFRLPGGRGTIASTMLHEIFHGLGIVPACAPDYEGRVAGRRAHLTTPSSDIMSMDRPGDGYTLDAGRNQYYGHGRPDCRDLMNSAIWEDVTKGDPIPGRERW